MSKETKTTETALRVNQEKLIQNLRFSFTNATNVINELMQNARRAGATQVEIDFAPETKTLTVRDDGCGIGDYQTLFTLAESGWDAETIENEMPFGLGFLSALFSCQNLEVESKGGRVSMTTADILSFKPVKVTPWVCCPAESRSMAMSAGAVPPMCKGLMPKAYMTVWNVASSSPPNPSTTAVGEG